MGRAQHTVSAPESPTHARLASVSVIVPTFNRAAYLGACLDSLLAQSMPARQIIVVDDGSTDSTKAVVARYGTRVHYLHKSNGGKPSAVNLALAHCQGELIWLFDDDDVALPRAIEQRLAVFAEQPEVGFVYSSHHLASNGPDRQIQQGRLYMPPFPGSEAFLLEIMRGCFYHLNSALVRHETWKALGGLDPTLLSGEDYDFQIRMARISTAAFCPTPSFLFRQHDGLRGAQQIRYAAGERSRVFRSYSQTVGRKLRNEFELGEFLMPPAKTTLGTEQRRCALIHRLHVMANHGCMDEFNEDLTALAALYTSTPGPSKTELLSVAASIQRGWAYDVCCADWPAFMAHVRQLRSHPHGKTLLLALAHGLWGLARSHPGSVGQRLLKLRRAARLAIEAHL
jgi:GT2 family glycosyltransferase